jgi:hypothetical protein
MLWCCNQQCILLSINWTDTSGFNQDTTNFSGSNGHAAYISGSNKTPPTPVAPMDVPPTSVAPMDAPPTPVAPTKTPPTPVAPTGTLPSATLPNATLPSSVPEAPPMPVPPTKGLLTAAQPTKSPPMLVPPTKLPPMSTSTTCPALSTENDLSQSYIGFEEGFSCEYGEECCCGEYPALICECINGEWMCLFTDHCLLPCSSDYAITTSDLAIVSLTATDVMTTRQQQSIYINAGGLVI